MPLDTIRQARTSSVRTRWQWLANPIVWTGMVAVAILWASSFYRVREDQFRREREAASGDVNIAKALQETVGNSIGQLNSILKIIRDLKQSDDSRSWESIVNPTYVKNTVAIQLAVVDADGYTLVTTNERAAVLNGLTDTGKATATPNGQASSKRLNFSDREHFKVHVNSNADRLFISKPLVGRGTGKTTIQITRKFWLPNGRFGGVLLASLDPAKLIEAYAELNLGDSGGVALIGDDDIIRAGTGAFAGRVGSSYREPKQTGQIRILHFAGSKHYHTVAKESLEGVDRLVTYRRVADYPLTVMVASAAESNPWLGETNLWNYWLVIFGTLGVLGAVIGILNFRLKADQSQAQRNEMELAKKLAETSAADRSVFLAVMSHEIRTPLNGVLGALDIIRDERLSERGRHCVNMATHSGEALLGLIDDVLLFTKAEFDHIDLAHDQFSMNDLVAQVKSELEPTIVRNKNRLRVVVSDEASRLVISDRRRLTQVLGNLTGNANKFTNGGLITIEVKTVSYDHEGLNANISVSDTGIGIPKEQQGLIFDRFRTLDASYTRRTDGTGLGLAICDKIVRAMGSVIDVTSQVGHGSRFSFDLKLPYADDMLKQSGTTVQSGELPALHSRKTILLAEDNQTNAYVAMELLGDAGHTVRHASNGCEAVVMAAAQQFDVILMDISMPEMDGIQATRAIRTSNSPNKSTPIIALTAHAIEGDKGKFLAAQIDGYLTKPIRRQALLDAIRDVGAVTTPTGVPARGSENKQPILDQKVFWEFLGERSIERVLKTLEIFVFELEEKAVELDEIIHTHDVDALKKLVRSALESGSMLGATLMVELSGAIEAQCTNKGEIDWSSTEELLATIKETIKVFGALAARGDLEAMLEEQRAAA